MKMIEGQLKRLGESTTDTRIEIVKYSLIQIGDQIITNVIIDRKLNNFLNDGLRTDQPTKLWFLQGGKAIMGVQVGNETRYFGTINPSFYSAVVLRVILCICVVIFAFFLGEKLGNNGFIFSVVTILLFIPILWDTSFRKIADYRKMAAVGGSKV